MSKRTLKKIDKLVSFDKKLSTLVKCEKNFIDSVRFMASSLSNLAQNLAEGTHKIKRKYGHNNKKYETFGNKHEDCECYLEYKSNKDDLIV